MKRTTLLTAILVLLFLSSTSIGAADKPNLAGEWLLNPDLSDDVRGEFMALIDNQRRGVLRSTSSGGGERGVGGGEVRGSGGFGRGGLATFRMHLRGGGIMGLMAMVSEGIEQLSILYEEPAVQITDANGNARLVYTDGREIEVAADGGGTIRVKSKWKKNKLITQINFPTKELMTRSISLTYSIERPDRLVVMTQVSLSSTTRPTPPLKVKRVYDRRPVA